MARRRDALEGTGRPEWVTNPQATDYLTLEEIRTDPLWPYRALLAYHDRLREWCLDVGADWIAEECGYPRVPAELRKELRMAQENMRVAVPRSVPQ